MLNDYIIMYFFYTLDFSSAVITVIFSGFNDSQFFLHHIILYFYMWCRRSASFVNMSLNQIVMANDFIS